MHSSFRLKHLFSFLNLILSASFVFGQTTKLRFSSSSSSAAVGHRKLLEDHSSASTSSFIANEYILKLSDDSPRLRSADVTTVQTTVQSLMKDAGAEKAEILYTYDHVFKGAAIRGLPRAKLFSILSNDLIDYAAPNKMISLSQTFGIEAVSQPEPVWNLDRIDQAKYPLNDSYKYNYTGTNVTVFVIDTGILANHSEFKSKWSPKSRVTCGYNAIKKEACTDLQGHGTHVAATAAGLTYGVAKNAKIVNVKVLNATGSGSYAGVIAGVNYVVGRKKLFPRVPMVINMSVGGPKDAAMDAAVNAAVTAGIFVAVAAGNDSTDACTASPAGATKAVTVGSTEMDTGSLFDDDLFSFDDDFWSFDDDLFTDDSSNTEPTDHISSFSNYGKCVDIFAPGSKIISADHTCSTCSKTLKGTSMASPHVAGVAALYLQRNVTMTPSAILTAMKATATKNLIEGLDSLSPNLLLRVNLPTK